MSRPTPVPPTDSSAHFSPTPATSPRLVSQYLYPRNLPLLRTLAPVYEQLAEAFPSSKVVIAKTDADGVGKALGKKFGVKGYPSEWTETPFEDGKWMLRLRLCCALCVCSG